MAAAVTMALAATARAHETMECGREEAFLEMYEALGDRTAQERIRQCNPRQRHCSILKESPSACRSLPQDYPGDIRQGDPCPNNPFLKPKNEQIFEESRKYGGAAERALSLHQMSRAGLLRAETTTPAELQAIEAVEQFGPRKQREENERRMREMEK